MKCACAVSISLAIVSESHISSSDSRFSLDKCTPGGGVWGEGKVIIQPWTQFVGDGTYAAPHKYLNQNLYDCWHLAKSIPSSSGGGMIASFLNHQQIHVLVHDMYLLKRAGKTMTVMLNLSNCLLLNSCLCKHIWDGSITYMQLLSFIPGEKITRFNDRCNSFGTCKSTKYIRNTILNP